MQKKRIWKKHPGFMQAPASPQKSVQWKWKKQRKKQHTRKSVIDGRKHFIGHLHKTGEDDWDKLWDNVSGHNEDTICF